MWHDLLGKSFEYGGRGPVQYDCYGLAIEVWRRLGKILPPQYQSTSDHSLIHTELSDGLEELKPIDKPQAGALVLFRIVPPYVSHMGVMLDRMRFIHILAKRNVAIDRLDNLYFKNKIAGFYDLA